MRYLLRHHETMDDLYLIINDIANEILAWDIEASYLQAFRLYALVKIEK
jgi:hypothetical protein